MSKKEQRKHIASTPRAEDFGGQWAFTRADALVKKIAAAEAEHARTIRAPQNSNGFFDFEDVCLLHLLMSAMSASIKIREIVFAGPKYKSELKALNATLKQGVSCIQWVLNTAEIPEEWNACIPDLTFFEGDLSDVMAACDLRGKGERTQFLHGALEALQTISTVMLAALPTPAQSGGDPACGTRKGAIDAGASAADDAALGDKTPDGKGGVKKDKFPSNWGPGFAAGADRSGKAQGDEGIAGNYFGH